MAVQALEAEGPGVDRIVAAHRHHISVALRSCGGGRIAGMDVVLVVGTGEPHREVAEVSLEATLAPGRTPIIACGGARGRVLSEGPLAAATSGQAPAAKVVGVVEAD